jgi:uncharacterized damage-inducible protein DinB
MARTSSLTVEAARDLLRYDRRLFERYARKVRALPGDGGVKDRGIGHLTLFGTLVHILGVHRGWFLYVVPGRFRELAADSQRSDWFPDDWRQFGGFARSMWSAEAAWSATITPAELRRSVKAPWMPGRYTVADAILQVTFEEAHHLGEIIAVLNQEDRKLPPMTWIQVQRQAGR